MRMATRVASNPAPVFGLDSRNSWVTAAFCSVILFLALSTVRVSGVIFYGIVETFGVTRQRASWPLTLSNSLVQLAGPLVGLLCRRYSCRTVLLCCSSITGVSVSLCYFAKSVYFLDIFLGVIHGVTRCGLFVGVNILVAQHFEKRRTTACSLISAVAGLDIVLASVVEWFRASYGTRGSLLLYGGILMNAFPFAIAVRSPPWITKSVIANRKAAGILDKQTADEERTFHQPTQQTAELCALGKGDVERAVHESTQQTMELCGLEKDDVDRAVHQFTPQATELCVLGKDSVGIELYTLKNTKEEPEVHADTKKQKGDVSANSCNPGMKQQAKKTAFDVARHLLAVNFWVDALSFAVVVLGMGLFVLMSTDLANDRGLSPSQGVYLLYAFSVTDIIFRPLGGLLIDSKIISLESVMLLGFLIEVLAFELLAWFTAQYAMLLASILMGTTCGSRIALQTPALVKDFGIEKLPIILGSLSFCVGMLSMLRPALVGVFRDKLGSYSGLLHTMAAVNALLSAVWLLKIFHVQKKQYPLHPIS
ncbi:monocarboxylate transporter 7-like isoform X1 [Haemaphysalis longicornis]